MKEKDIGPPADPKTRERRKETFRAKFLLGDTEGDSWTWSRRWDVPTGYFRVTAKAWYAFGLRVPVEITGVTEPAVIETTGANDAAGEYTVTLSARALDANSAFYEEVGLDRSEIHEGKELVLEAGFQVQFQLKVLGININKSIPADGGFDFGQDFTPPFGGGGGPEVWIPSALTRTEVGILGIIKGSARVGFNVAGEGTIQADCTALYGNDEIRSWLPGGKKEAKKTHTLAFGGTGAERKLTAELSPLERSGSAKEFGYRLSDPEFHWRVRLIPGIRADLQVKAKPVFSDTFTIGPLWLDDLAVDLGTLKLGAHPGTTGIYRVKNGEKSWDKSK
jgi:hypothetical protein